MFAGRWTGQTVVIFQLQDAPYIYHVAVAQGDYLQVQCALVQICSTASTSLAGGSADASPLISHSMLLTLLYALRVPDVAPSETAARIW